MNNDIDKLHKFIILYNAQLNGWDVHKINEDNFYIKRKKKNKEEKLELKKLINSLYKSPINLKTILNN